MLSSFIQTIGVAITTLMAIGALFGALNTMYGAVSARTKEIATLRALGFGASPIVLSVMFESLVPEVITKGRHDPCVGIRATPIAEALLALVVMDHALRHRAQCGDVVLPTPDIAAAGRA
jgi:hypothetical protein